MDNKQLTPISTETPFGGERSIIAPAGTLAATVGMEREWVRGETM
jgi:hypothetical protein